MPPPHESGSGLEPLITNRHGERYHDFETATRAIAALLSGGGRTWFRYHHYSAFTVHISHHTARIFALTIGYTGADREHKTVVWEPDRDLSDEVAGHFGLNAGPDIDTIADLLGHLADAMSDTWSRRPEAR